MMLLDTDFLMSSSSDFIQSTMYYLTDLTIGQDSSVKVVYCVRAGCTNVWATPYGSVQTVI